ncbi:MAG: hypothetical protein AAGB12_10150 [Pseudomonadota bacterium]
MKYPNSIFLMFSFSIMVGCGDSSETLDSPAVTNPDTEENNNSDMTSPEDGEPSHDDSTTSEENTNESTALKDTRLVVWKRVSALQNDLSQALALDKTTMCLELGSMDCFASVHLSPLGGNEPFELSQYEPIKEPSATTSIAIDRVVMSACSTKVDNEIALDATIDQEKIFSFYDLTTRSLPNDNNYLASVDQQNQRLYQRILGRDAIDEELLVLRQIVTGADGVTTVANSDVAKLSCYAIATSTEFLFL